MATDLDRSFQMPRRDELGLFTISNGSGLSISALPNGPLFAIEYADDKGSVQVNQIQGSPLAGGVGRLYLRIGGAAPEVVELVGPRANGSFGHDATSLSWSGKTGDIGYNVRLELHPSETAWFWRASIRHLKDGTLPVDLVLIQDVGLGDRGFLMNSEAYASQYVDHHIADHETFGPVVMNRQNLKQSGARNPGSRRAASMGRLPMPRMRSSWCRRATASATCWSAPSAPACRANGGSRRPRVPPFSRNRSPCRQAARP